LQGVLRLGREFYEKKHNFLRKKSEHGGFRRYKKSPAPWARDTASTEK
jgi:hypothetical protein